MTDALIRLLPGPEDSDRPWLVWYSPGERIELTGHVLSMWQAKCAGLITSEAGPGATVHLGMGPHWRALTWCAGAWAAGASVLLGDVCTSSSFVGNPQETAVNLSVAFRNHWLFPSADIQVLVAEESLAVRWPAALPPLALDGIADVMGQADRFPAVPVPGTAPALMVVEDGRLRTVTRDGLAESASRSATASAREASGRALLVRPRTIEQTVLGVLTAWHTGRTAVLVPFEADAELLAAAVRQEGLPGVPEPRPRA